MWETFQIQGKANKLHKIEYHECRYVYMGMLVFNDNIRLWFSRELVEHRVKIYSQLL